MTSRKTVLSLAVGTAFAATVAAAPLASAADNPFEMDSLKNGYQVVAAKDEEGKCGEGKCGGAGKGDEGKCGGATDDKGGEGKCGGSN